MKKSNAVFFLGMLFTVLLFVPHMSEAYGGIGISVPVGGGASTETISDGESYAAVTMDGLAMEYFAKEESGKLHVELRVKNMTASPIVHTHPTGQVYDFTLTDEAGKEIWRWSEGMAFTQAFQSVAWPAGETTVYAMDIPRKAYKKIKDEAVLVNIYLIDTPYALSLRLSKAKKTVEHNSPIVIHGGWGTGDRW